MINAPNVKTCLAMLLFIFLGCGNKATGEKKKVQQEKNIIKEKLSVKKLESNIVSKDKLIDVRLEHDTLSFVSSGSQYDYPFGKFETIEAFMQKTKIFTNTVEIDPHGASGPAKLYRLTYRESFVKLIYQPNTKKMEIVSASINNKEIEPGDTKIGMKKEVFLSKFFKGNLDFSGIRYIKIRSVPKGIEYIYDLFYDVVAGVFIDTDYQVDRR